MKYSNIPFKVNNAQSELPWESAACLSGALLNSFEFRYIIFNISIIIMNVFNHQSWKQKKLGPIKTVDL